MYAYMCSPWTQTTNNVVKAGGRGWREKGRRMRLDEVGQREKNWGISVIMTTIKKTHSRHSVVNLQIKFIRFLKNAIESCKCDNV